MHRQPLKPALRFPVICSADRNPAARVRLATKIFETISELLLGKELKSEGSDAHQQYVFWNQAGRTQMIVNASPIFPGRRVLT